MRWTVKPKPEQESIDRLAQTLGIDDLVAQLLIQRGITNYNEAKAFFRPELNHLHDPFLMKDMQKAVKRIEQAITQGENILVYGDYDVDGTTSVALMSSFLMESYPNVATYIPDRYLEGYGISFQGIDFAADNDVSLMIALDCGIKAIEQIQYAKEKGIDVIVCDHHRPGAELPDAIAVLDPKQHDCDYPYKELCGCGVGFKLIQALSTKWGNTIDDILLYLDLVATAIAADIVPITGENRVLAYYGLKVINENPRTGIKALINQTKKRELTITDVVFIIAPRINAAGRMKHGQHAVNLLTETNFAQAQQFASEIELFNTERRSLDQEITQEALVQIQENKEEEKFTSVVYNENWHKGVIGIVASRLTETYYRPTLVFTKSGDKLAASARSVKGFDIYNALEGCSDCLEQFGGHKYAAGLTLLEEQYETFKSQFERVVSETIDPKLLQPEISIDAKIQMDQITPKLMRILKQFAPFGPGNMTPVFMAEGLKDTGYARGVGEGEKHLKCSLYQLGSEPIGGIGFNLGDKLDVVKRIKPFDAVFSLDENEWNGTVSLQLKLRDIRQLFMDPYAALRYKEFNIFLLVRFAMVFAWSMQFIVIEWQVYSLTKDPLSLGIIGLMEVVPAVSMALFAGHIVDQREKRNLLVVCIAGFSVISFGLFVLSWPGLEDSWESTTILYSIYALVFLGGFVRSFLGPTIFSLIALIVPKKIYPNAATWSSSTWQLASVLGPALAGFSISWIGVHWSMCVIFGFSLMALIFLFQIPPKPIMNPKIGEPVFQSLKDGLKFVFGNKAIFGALTLDMIAVLFGGAVALLPVYAQDILHVGSEGFGILRAAPAVGASITMLGSTRFPLHKNAGKKLLMAVFAFGICIIVFGLSELFWLSVIALFVSGAVDGISMIIRQTILQIKTPDNMRGRVASVNSMFVGSSNELGAFESGLTAKLMGTVTAVVFGGCMTLLTVSATAIASPTFRRLDLQKDIEEHEKED